MSAHGPGPAKLSGGASKLRLEKHNAVKGNTTSLRGRDDLLDEDEYRWGADTVELDRFPKDGPRQDVRRVTLEKVDSLNDRAAGPRDGARRESARRALLS